MNRKLIAEKTRLALFLLLTFTAAFFHFYRTCGAAGLTSALAVQSPQPVFQVLTIFMGNAPYSFLGQSLAAEADLNGDSKQDLVIGGNGAGPMREGVVYIFYQKSFSRLTDLSSADVRIVGESSNDQFGWAVTTRGDLNGDGNRDLVAAALKPGKRGRVYIFLGGEKRMSGQLSAGDADHVIISRDSTETFGFTVRADGDINGDGIDDLVIGAPANSDAGKDAGKIYIFHGGGWGKEVFADDAACVITGEMPRANLGSSIAFGGDCTGNGICDLVIGSFFCSIDSANSGRIYVFEGRHLWHQRMSARQAELIIKGYHKDSWLGTSAEIIGDVSGDGFDELIVGASGEYVKGGDAGAAYLFYGGKWSGIVSARQADLTLVSNRTGNNFGSTIIRAGDMDDDGREDWIISEPGGVIAGEKAFGRIYLFPTSLIGKAKLTTIIEEPIPKNNFGQMVTVGDITGNGRNEIIVGANWDNKAGEKSGKVVMFRIRTVGK